MTIFISSTFADLIDYREAAHAAILCLRHHASDMIYFSSDERSAVDVTSDLIGKSSLVLLILAHSYGHIDNNDKKERSFTEIEYDVARSKKIPVLAFLVDPDHPWPPSKIESDSIKAKKLSNFKERVEKEVIRKLFTTPDSLSILVTQAISNFDERLSLNKIERTTKRSIYQCNVPSAMMVRSDLLVEIGEAVDGLPLLLSISRSQDINSHLATLAENLERNIQTSPFDGIARVLRDEGERIWNSKGVYDVNINNNSIIKCYVTYENLSVLFAPSILARAVPLPYELESQMPHRVSNDKDFDDGGTMATLIEARRGPDSRLQSTGGRNRFLAIPISGGELLAAGWEDPEKRFARNNLCISWRPFINESILGLRNCLFSVYAKSKTRSSDESKIWVNENIDDINKKVKKHCSRIKMRITNIRSVIASLGSR